MTLTSILKRLNQSTPFDEEQFTRFLQDILGWNDFAIARDNLPVHLHEATEEFSRLNTSKQHNTYVWILKLKRQNAQVERDLLDFIAKKSPNVSWSFGTPKSTIGNSAGWVWSMNNLTIDGWTSVTNIQTTLGHSCCWTISIQTNLCRHSNHTSSKPNCKVSC